MGLRPLPAYPPPHRGRTRPAPTRRPRLRSRPAPPPLLPRLHIPAPSPRPSRAARPDAGLSWAPSSNLGSLGPRPPSCFDNLWPQSQLSAPLRLPRLSFLRWTPTSLARGRHLDGGQREHGGPGLSPDALVNPVEARLRLLGLLCLLRWGRSASPHLGVLNQLRGKCFASVGGTWDWENGRKRMGQACARRV